MDCLSKKWRFNEIRQVRRIRDEILTCENEGRAKHLLMELPNVKGYKSETGSFSKSYLTLKLVGGFEYIFHENELIECYRKAGQKAYKEWSKGILWRSNNEIS